MADTSWFESAAPLAPGATPGAPATHKNPPGIRHRTIFISDTHLGTRGCKADSLADFLAHNDCETLYLVGDIVDGWQLRRWYWPEAQDKVVAEILHKSIRHPRHLRPRQP